MTREQFAIWAAALATYYPRQTIIPNKQAMELWYRRLKDIDFAAAEQALNEWVDTERWPPTIADIRERSASAHAGGWWEQLAQVQRVVGYIGDGGKT